MPRPFLRHAQPATFIPRAAIRSVEFVRAGGTSSTFDFYVHRRDGGLQEFGNISRNELGALEGGHGALGGLLLGTAGRACLWVHGRA